MQKTKFSKSHSLTNLKYLFEKKKLLLNPEYQREAVWGNYQKQLLIDSLLRDIDIPKLYFRVRAKDSKGSSKEYEVVDGQQRLRSIFEFFNNDFALSEDSDDLDGHKIANCTYEQLPMDLQIDFQNKTLDVVELIEYGMMTLRRCFCDCRMERR